MKSWEINEPSEEEDGQKLPTKKHQINVSISSIKTKNC